MVLCDQCTADGIDSAAAARVGVEALCWRHALAIMESQAQFSCIEPGCNGYPAVAFPEQTGTDPTGLGLFNYGWVCEKHRGQHVNAFDFPIEQVEKPAPADQSSCASPGCTGYPSKTASNVWWCDRHFNGIIVNGSMVQAPTPGKKKK